jgi:hypothetical protein
MKIGAVDRELREGNLRMNWTFEMIVLCKKLAFRAGNTMHPFSLLDDIPQKRPEALAH